MSLYNEFKVHQIKTNAQETKEFLDDLVDEYEKKTKLLAEIIAKPESARVEELKEKIHQAEMENIELTNKYEEYISPEEIDYMFGSYIKHIKDVGTTMYHKPKWVVVHNALGVYRALECECGQCLYNGSIY